MVITQCKDCAYTSVCKYKDVLHEATSKANKLAIHLKTEEGERDYSLKYDTMPFPLDAAVSIQCKIYSAAKTQAEADDEVKITEMRNDFELERLRSCICSGPHNA